MPVRMEFLFEMVIKVLAPFTTVLNLSTSPRLSRTTRVSAHGPRSVYTCQRRRATGVSPSSAGTQRSRYRAYDHQPGEYLQRER